MRPSSATEDLVLHHTADLRREGERLRELLRERTLERDVAVNQRAALAAELATLRPRCAAAERRVAEFEAAASDAVRALEEHQRRTCPHTVTFAARGRFWCASCRAEVAP